MKKRYIAIIAAIGLIAACETTTARDMQRAQTLCADKTDKAQEACISQTYAGLRENRMTDRQRLGMTRRDTGKPEGGSQTLREADNQNGL